jgi:hypothetical protein
MGGKGKLSAALQPSLSPIEYYFGASIKIDATTHNT